MNFFLVGLHQKKSYGNIVFESLYETIPVSYITFDSKYLTTQFNVVKLNASHYNQIPVLTLDASNSEFRPYFTLKGRYQKYIRSNNITLNGSYLKLNYTNFYFTGKYTASSQKYIKFDASEIKRNYTVFSYMHHYVANTFVRVGLTGVYIYKVNKTEEPTSISLINSYSNARPIYFNVGGIETSGSMSVEANSTTGGMFYGEIKINVTSRITLKGILSNSCGFRAEKLVNIMGIDSPIGKITTVTPICIGGFLSYPSYFTAIKNPVGGFISNVMYFKIRRDIKEYKFYEASLSIPLIFKNIKFKNYIQPFKFVDVLIMNNSKINNIFGFEKKADYTWKFEDYHFNDIVETKTDIYYHTLVSYKITSLIYGFRRSGKSKRNYGVVYGLIYNLFVLPTAKSTYLFKDTKDSSLFVKKMHISSSTDKYVVNSFLPFTDDLSLCVKINNQKTDFNFYLLDIQKNINLFKLPDKKTIITMESYKINFLISAKSLNVCDTFNGNRLVTNLHRHFYTSSELNILNTVLTSYQTFEQNIGGILFLTTFVISETKINGITLGGIPFSLQNNKTHVNIINVTETFSISIHIDFSKLNDIILLEIPFHVSATEGSPNIDGLTLEANMFIGRENIKNMIFSLCEFKVA